MKSNLEVLIRDFLNILEEKEVRLLSWGCVEGGFSQDEIQKLGEEFLNQKSSYLDPMEFLGEMLERRLIFLIDYGDTRWVRTRMAESVRLFARLRQIFPKHSWKVSPTLVADFRFSLQPRTYPRRDIAPDAVLSSLSDIKITRKTQVYIQQILGSSGDNPLLLSKFQLMATHRMLKDLKLKKDRGMIVCAGTGTGKTLAFYLPALSFIAENIEKETSCWTKAVAIYPRNELLKDQFSETYREARKLDEILINKGKRKITIGAFFGPTPHKAQWAKTSWIKRGKYLICPYLRCPECGGDMTWDENDIKLEKEVLRCIQTRCQGFVEENEVVLTRDKMIDNPPDILFTTTESLNRQLVDNRYNKVFGIGIKRRPRIVLLDEVHTYAGIHGAQVAYLIRRWRHKAQLKAHFTGLSATLEEAGEFFANLVGLFPSEVLDVNPREDLIQEGMEYQLILRGDPVSATSLLSTSIQATMLLRRVLDPRENPVSGGIYGKRVFTFTDDLDVTNRFFHDLLDAEGLNSWNQKIRGKNPLAALRSRNQPEKQARLAEGQSWLLCEEIGHPENLSDSLRVGRTSSQDAGVDEKSDVVVATASLEVGFNDPAVGAVLQHKAPLDMASFLQRKGRAGRQRIMRPWTVTVLSDYGRDRVTYQSYDLLFNPRIPRRGLPIGNRYVQRMQSVYAFLDWLGEQGELVHIPGTLWNDLSAPADELYKNKNSINLCQQRQEKVISILKEFLENFKMLKTLKIYLEQALQLREDEVDSLLWEPPRALVLNVLPAIMRRLESNWQLWSVPGSGKNAEKEYYNPYTPLPDFIPPNLFSDLQLPEVTIKTPPATKGKDSEISSLPIVQALNTFSPGRVTRRFGVVHRYIRHWIPVTQSETRQSLDIGKFCTQSFFVKMVKFKGKDKIQKVPCYRPVQMEPDLTPKKIKTTSNSQLIWKTQIIPDGKGFMLKVPLSSFWEDLIEEVRFYLHNHNDSAEVRRFCVGANAQLRFDNGTEMETSIDFIKGEEGNQVCLGFVHNVDGVLFLCKVPDNFQIRKDDPNRAKVNSFRTAFFQYRLINAPGLNGKANIFQREWLSQIFLSALISRALLQNKDLEEACQDLYREGFPKEMDNVMKNIFQTIEVESLEVDQEDNENEKSSQRQRVHDNLRELFQDQLVQDTLKVLGRTLWEDPDISWQEWARERFKATLGSALLQACLQITPDIESGDLLLDIDPGPLDDYNNLPPGIEPIWITEGTGGGAGVVEEVLRRYADDPRGFFRLVESALEPGDFEIVNNELTRLLNLARDNAQVSAAMEKVRKSTSYQELKGSMENFMELLNQKGVLLIHPVISAINARILRPGTSESTDTLLQEIIQEWDQEEERLRVEIDSRVFAYVSSTRKEYIPYLINVQGSAPESQLWRFQAFYSLLWPRGNLIRTQVLSHYNPFAKMPATDRELVKDILYQDKQEISLEDSNWKEKLCSALAGQGRASLSTAMDNQDALRKAVLEMAVTPVETGYLLVYSRIEGCRREGSKTIVNFDIREVVQ